MNPRDADTQLVLSKFKEAGLECENASVQNLDDWRRVLEGKVVLVASGREVINADVLRLGEKLKLVQRYGIGYDRVDTQAAASKGIYVCNVQEILAETTAEHAWALILSSSKKVVQADRAVRSQQWTSGKTQNLVGTELLGKTLGIVGLGQIGRRVSRIAQAFNMNVITYHPRITQWTAQLFGAKLVHSLEFLLRESDLVVLSVPLTAETKHMIGSAQLSMMKRDALLVNVSRGGVLDDSALAEALREGKIGSAALDVFEAEPLSPDSPLLQFENVVLTPHIGSWSKEAKTTQAVEMVKNIKRFLQGEKPWWVVNAESLQRHSPVAKGK